MAGGHKGDQVDRLQWPRLAAVLLLCVPLLPGCSSRAPRARQTPVEAPEVAQERQVERKLAVESFLARNRRLDAVAYPMWTKGSELCAPRTSLRVWALFATKSELSAEEQTVYAELLPVDELPTILMTTPGGPAEAAGLKAGDVITAVNGVPLSHGADGKKAIFQETSQSKGQPMRFSYLRSGVPGEAVVVPVISCDYPIRYIAADSINAVSDGKQVLIFSGVMRFTENDDELAEVMAHELAHNVEGHIELQKHNARKGAIIDAVIAAGGVNTHGKFAKRAFLRYSQDFENEADYVGLYFAARGGYNLDQAPMFWRRYAAEHPESIRNNFQAVHPSSPQRFTAMEKAIVEIKAKIAAGQPLVPDLKPIPGRTLPAQPEPPAQPESPPQSEPPAQPEAAQPEAAPVE